MWKSLRDINLVFFTYVANYLLAFVVGVMVARGLGTEGRGVYDVVILTVSMAQAVMSLGIGVAGLYYIGKKTYSTRDLLSNSQFVVVVSVAVSALLVLLAAGTVGGRLLDRGYPYWVFIFGVPLFLNFNLLLSFLQAHSRFLAMNSVLIFRPLVMIALLVGGVLAGGLTTVNVLVFWAIAVLAAVALALILIGVRNVRLGGIVWPRWDVLKAQVKFGAQGQLGNILQLLNYRLDKYIVLGFIGTAGVGIYGVAVAVTESIWFIPNAVAVVLLPQMTRLGKKEAAALTPVACRQTLALSLLAAAGIGVVSPLLLPLFFGNDFSPAVNAVYWLLPGAVALAGTKVLASYIFSQGKPLINTYITVASLAVTLVADLALVPSFGIKGAAAASSLAYTVSLVLSVAMYGRISGQSIRGALLLSGDDFRLYGRIVRSLWLRQPIIEVAQPDIEGEA